MMVYGVMSYFYNIYLLLPETVIEDIAYSVIRCRVFLARDLSKEKVNDF